MADMMVIGGSGWALWNVYDGELQHDPDLFLQPRRRNYFREIEKIFLALQFDKSYIVGVGNDADAEPEWG